MAEIIDLTKNERTFQELLGGDGRRGPRRQRQAAENGEKIEELLSIAEASKRCGLSRHRLDAAINRGDLPFYQFDGRSRKVKASDVYAWLESKRRRVGVMEGDEV